MKQIIAPEEVLAKIKDLPAAQRWTFGVTFLCGALTHMYVFTNKFENADDLGCFQGPGGGTIFQGRWMTGILSNLRMDTMGDFSMPWVNGMLAVLFTALAALLLVRMLGLRSALAGGLLGACMVTFPSMAMQFSFMYLAPYFMLALLLGVAGALVGAAAVEKTSRRGQILCLLLGMCLIAASMGGYQIFLSVSAVLVMVRLMQATVSGESGKALARRTAFSLAVLVGGVVIYFLVTKVILLLLHADMMDMHGTSMGAIQLSDLPQVVKNCYLAILQMMTGNYLGVTGTVFVRGLTCVVVLVTVGTGIFFLRKLLRKKEVGRAVFLLAQMLAFPIALNLVYLMLPSNPGDVYILMVYGVTGIYFIPALVLDSCNVKPCNAKCLLQWLLVLSLGGSALLYAQQCNVIYMYGDLCHQSAVSYFTAMMAQVKAAPGYRDDVPVAFIGEPEDGTIPSLEDMFEKEIGTISGIDGIRNREILDGSFYYGYMRLYCGFAPVQCEDEQIRALTQTPEFAQMPVYPSAGAVELIDNTLVVKLENVK